MLLSERTFRAGLVLLAGLLIVLIILLTILAVRG